MEAQPVTPQQWLRLVMYALTIMVAVALVSQFWATGERLGRALAVLAGAFVFNAGLLLSLLVYAMLTGAGPAPWRDSVITLNTVVMAGSLLAVYAVLNRRGDP